MNFGLSKIALNDLRFDRGDELGRECDRLKTGILYNGGDVHTDRPGVDDDDDTDES